MKTSILRTLATLSLSAVLGPVSLMAQLPILVKVPFEFSVGSKSFAAGEYRIGEQTHHVLAVRVRSSPLGRPQRPAIFRRERRPGTKGRLPFSFKQRPVLHDNSAYTLEDVIEYFNSQQYNNSHDGRGVPIHMGHAEMSDLLEFLKVL